MLVLLSRRSFLTASDLDSEGIFHVEKLDSWGSSPSTVLDTVAPRTTGRRHSARAYAGPADALRTILYAFAAYGAGTATCFCCAQGTDIRNTPALPVRAVVNICITFGEEGRVRNAEESQAFSARRVTAARALCQTIREIGKQMTGRPKAESGLDLHGTPTDLRARRRCFRLRGAVRGAPRITGERTRHVETWDGQRISMLSWQASLRSVPFQPARLCFQWAWCAYVLFSFFVSWERELVSHTTPRSPGRHRQRHEARLPSRELRAASRPETLNTNAARHKKFRA